MIPVKEDRTVISSGVEESIAFSISSKDSVHIMGILRDQLYSDKIAAVIREICANAADANAMNDRRDQPISVFLPTLADPCLRIRDAGPGLSLDDVRTVFSQYGASTKRDSNEVVGMLGIGSKSPFAYSDSFVVVSWHGGSKATYNAVIDESGAGRIDLLALEDCDPSETGLEVQMPVRPADCKAFEDRAKAILVHFEPRPSINIELPKPPKTRDVQGGKILDEEDRYGSGSKWTAVMGRIPYPISLDQLTSGTGGSDLTRAAQRVSGTLHFDIGELQFAASREALKYSDGTRATLIARINRAIDDYVRMMLTGIEKESNWEQRIRINAISNRGLPVPPALKRLVDYSISFQVETLGGQRGGLNIIKGQTFALQIRNYNERMTMTNSIVIDGKTRLILKDDRRSMAGYTLEGRDIVVVDHSGSDSVSRLIKAVDAFTKAHSIDGIPIVLLSTLKWEKPKSTKVVAPRDKEKAKARVFVLDQKNLTGEGSSADWTPRDHTPSPEDVFVILESYRVPGFDSFYESVREDEAMFRNLGLAMPPVIGYKSTKAKPVSASDCEGTEYHKWKWAGMARLLLTHPDVARVADALSYTRGENGSHESWFQGSGDYWIKDELGEGHVITTFAAEEKGSRMVLSAATALINRAAQVVRAAASKVPSKGDTARGEITKRYPLLAAAPGGALAGNNRKLWVDYVKLIDSLTQQQQQIIQEAA
jgi:hypothetical protein